MSIILFAFARCFIMKNVILAHNTWIGLIKKVLTTKNECFVHIKGSI